MSYTKKTFRYNQRHREVTQKLQVLHLESLAESRIENWMADKEEVQLVDMVLRIRNKLTEAADLNLPLPELAIEQLNSHLEKLINRLPQVHNLYKFLKVEIKD